MKESTAEMIRQLELELLRLDDFQWRLSRMSAEERAEAAHSLGRTAEALGKKALALARSVTLALPADALTAEPPRARA